MFKLKRIAEITRGKLNNNGSIEISSIVTDSRRVVPGALFVAIKGPHYDGHDFAEEALDAGARGVIVQRDVDIRPAVIVDDTIQALGKIGHEYVNRFELARIGITGTNGKTTTKALINSILSNAGPTCAAEKSYNNAIGIPLTIFRLKEIHKYLVMEYGTNHPGEIGRLLEIAQPNIAVLTNIGPGHLEGFGTVQAIREEKLTLLRAVGSDGHAVYPDGLGPEGLQAQSMTFGVGRGAINGQDLVFDAEGSKFKVSGKQYRLKLLGRGNVLNALAAIAVAKILGIPEHNISDGLSRCEPVDGRLVISKIKGITIIDDSYNSNPVSLREAVDVMQTIKVKRRIVVLGDMLELGNNAQDIHCDLGKEIRGKVDMLITFGELAANFVAGFGKGECFQDKEKLVNFLQDHIAEGDLILVKGSRKMAMEEIIEGLEA